MKAPIFIIGNPRSGTTLFRLMINAHRNIVVPPECGFALWWQPKYGKSTAEHFSDSNFVAEFISDIATSKKIETWHLDFKELARQLLNNNIDNYAAAVSFIYNLYGQSKGRTNTRWGDKNNFHINHVSDLAAMFPEAYFLHIIRDGRDVACSYRVLSASKIDSQYAPKLPDAITDIANEWKDNICGAIKSFEQNNWKNVLEVRYEDLVSAPAVVLKKVCETIGEYYDPYMLKYASQEKMNEHEPVEFLQWKSKTLEKPSTNEVGKYAKELEQNQIKEFESVAEEILRRYHYL